MKDLMKHLDILISRYPVLEESRQDIEKAYLVLEECYREKKKVLIAGNGGSAADAEHIVGELMKGFKPSRFMILTICYFAYLIVITFIYHNKAADIHLIISNLKIVFMLCVIEYLLKRTPNSTINIMFFILITFVIIDFASIVLFPNGLYQTEQIWNEWSSSQEAQWIYGNKNNRVYWYAVLSIITWLRYVFNNKSKVMVLITSGISIVAMMLVKSSTATIVAILVSVGFFYLTYKKQTNINMNSYGILVIYGCITVLILLGSTSLLKPFVEGVLHKDMTFTGRSIAWERVLLLIASKPVFGWGVVDGETATGLLKSIAFVNPHNQLLDCLWQGGIILVFILSLIMITITSLFSSIVFAAFFSLGKVFYALWIPGQDIDLIYVLTVITMLSSVIEGPVYPLYYIYTLTVKNKIPCLVTVVGGILNVAGMAILVKYSSLGIYSIVLTTTVIMLFINLVTNPIYMTHCLKIEWFTFYPTLLRTIISCTCMTISFTLIAKTLNPNTWVSFVLTAILCGVIGCIIHLVFVFSRDEKSRILVIIKSKEK